MRALSDVSMTVLVHMRVVSECDRIRNCLFGVVCLVLLVHVDSSFLTDDFRLEITH